MNVWALDIHDLAASKLMAGRDKDFEFLQFLFITDCAIFPPAWPSPIELIPAKSICWRTP